MKKFVFFLLSTLSLSSCKVDPEILPAVEVASLQQVIPKNWPSPVYQFEKNPITQEKYELGRFLFYEPLLSRDNSISCGTCHQVFVAFTQADHKVSHGIDNQDGKRNSPALFNLAWHPYFMADGAINHIEVQPLAPISNPIEMDENINVVMTKLQASVKYQKLYKAAYGDSLVTSERTMKAIAQFMGLLVSNNSKYDRVMRDEAEFTTQESNGYNLFKAKCSSCHAEPLFSDFKYRNNGISIDPKKQDGGRGALKLEEPEHLYCFKTPSLRNIAKTGPYMHDGRYATLQECLDHYTSKMDNKINLDPLLVNGIPMTSEEKQDILSFLNTLTDFEFISNSQFKDPNFK